MFFALMHNGDDECFLHNGDDELFSFRFPRGKRALDAANEPGLHLWPAKEFRSHKASEILFRPNLLDQFRFRSRFFNLLGNTFFALMHNGDDEFCADSN